MMEKGWALLQLMFQRFPKLTAALATTLIVGPYIHPFLLKESDKSGYSAGYQRGREEAIHQTEQELQASNDYEAKRQTISTARLHQLLNAPRGTINILNKQWHCLFDNGKAICVPTDTYVEMERRWTDTINKNRGSST